MIHTLSGLPILACAVLDALGLVGLGCESSTGKLCFFSLSIAAAVMELDVFSFGRPRS